MTTLSKAINSVLIVSFLKWINKCLGFVREMLIAYFFGSGVITDAYFIARTISKEISTSLGEAVKSTTIPMFKNDKNEQVNYMNKILNLLMIVSIIIVLLGFFFAPALVKVFASGFAGEQFELTILLTRIGLPIGAFAVFTSLFKAYLHRNEHFLIPSLDGIPYNIVYVIFLVFFSGVYGIQGLMVASVIAALSKFLFHIPKTKGFGYKYEAVFNLADVETKKTIRMSFPIIITSLGRRINIIVDKTLASLLQTGSVSALNYAAGLKDLILQVFIQSLITVTFPMMSKESSDIDFLKKSLLHSINIMLVLLIPITSGAVILSTPIIELLYERGEFGTQATQMTAYALIFYSFGFVGLGLKNVIRRGFFVLKDTYTPMINSFITIFMNIILNIILVNFFAHGGLALATSITAIFTSLLLLYSIKKRLGSFNIKKIFICFIKSLFSAIIMSIVVYLLYYHILNHLTLLNLQIVNEIMILVFTITVGALVYFGACLLMKIEEIEKLVKIFKDRFNSF
ncbi:murein biosynthesis integral membrane protein MurJ [Natranaerobius trueperi]|uniref:Probable lipid II flippase MurJ n=1 Tax=Natranaerobius trueperi TaxID=759412 RepID=A0A226BW56_9FIRM|nr:murein biosynthesis integral membrane protein MurJ [Natranaerobius trueperi]OWZ83236.1 murein biosynthesis integral membrane protein MurJ [Natranaerobius trueperi]